MDIRVARPIRVTAAALVLVVGGGGVITPAEALPIVTIFCGMTVASSIKVANDLPNCVLDGLVIADADVVIDLNDHTIDGNGTDNVMAVEAGINNSAGHDGLIVKRGVIKEFERGVSGIGANDNRFERLTVAGNTFTGLTLTGDRLVVRRCTFAGNGSTGINFGGDDLKIERNVVSGNGDSGIGGTGDRNEFKRNAVAGNRSAGINSSGLDNVISKNIVTGNAGPGIFMQGTNPRIDGNVASGNGFDPPGTDNLAGRGIETGGSSGTTGGNNVALGNDQAPDCNPEFLC